MNENEINNQENEIESEDAVKNDILEKLSGRYLVVIVGIIITGVILWLFFGIKPESKEVDVAIREISSGLNELSTLSSSRDYNNAIVKADQLLIRAREEGAPPFVEATILAQKAINLFRTNDVDKQIEAVQIAKSIAGDSRISPKTRALAINRILSFYYSCRSQYIYDDIVTGEPFVELRDASEKNTIQKVAKSSLDLFPTSIGILHEANWYTGELLDNKELSNDLRIKYLDTIKSSVSQAKDLFGEESKDGISRSSEVLYKHWLGYHLAVLAKEGALDPEEFENSFKSAISLYVPDQNDSKVVATTVAFTHYYYASLLGEVFGDERLDDQREILNDLIKMVYENPALYSTGFINLVNVERDRLPETRDHNYKWFVDLSKISPEFKEFLEANRWNF